MGERRCLVLLLIGTEVGDVAGQFRVAVGQSRKLLAVMVVNFGLDRDRAGHGSLWPQQRGGCAQRKTCHMPKGLEQGGTYLTFSDHPVKGRKVPGFPVPHPGDFACRRVAIAQHRKLPGINPHRAIFPGLIDA